MPVVSDPPSVGTPIVDRQGLATHHFRDWIVAPGQGDALGLLEAIQQSVYQPVNSTVVLTNQNASIATTAFPLGTFPGGRYRLSWYLRITTVDGVSSSVTVAFGFTESGSAQVLTGSAFAIDAVTPPQTGSAPLIVSDAGASITYSTTYASNTPGKMIYNLTLTIEQLAPT